jgi:hypothetical protein
VNNELMTANLWNELDESQSENLNGGYYYGYTSQYISIGGGVGSLQVNGGDGSQLNIYPVGKAPNYRPYYYY